MNDFYNCEYLSERVAALAKERDNLRGELVRAEERLQEWEKFRRELLSAGKTPPEKWEGKRC